MPLDCHSSEVVVSSPRLSSIRTLESGYVFALVKELTELPGPTGHEDPVQDWIVNRWSQFAAEVRRTRVNNVVARIGGAGPRLLGRVGKITTRGGCRR
jgi:acetylornithine deacetylase/succinyl-diaminopimelate desuccinylase-like protein